MTHRSRTPSTAAGLACGAALALLLALAPGALAAEDLVPDVVGLDLEDAGRLLDAAGLEAEVRWVAGRPQGRIISQRPGGLALRAGHQGVQLEVGGRPPTPPPSEPDPVVPAEPPEPSAPEARPPVEAPTDGPPTGRLPVPGPTPPGGREGPAETPPRPAPGPREPRPPVAPPPGPRPPAEPSPTVAPPSDEPLPAAPAGRVANRNGPELPNALSLTVEEARRALARWQLVEEQTFGMPDLVGRIVNQVPFPGEPLAFGETVIVVVAVDELPSPEHRSVPRVLEMPVRTATARLREEGWPVELRSIPSIPSLRGQVLGQRPLPGSLAPRGTTVFVRFGAGGLAPPPEEAPPPAPVLRPDEPLSPFPSPTDGPTEEPTPPTPPTPTVPEPRPPTEPLPPTEPAPAEPGAMPPPSLPQTLATPTLISPSEGQSFPRAYGSTFQWTDVPGAQRYQWELQRQTREGIWQVEASQEVDGTRYRPARMDRGHFRWRVRAVNDRTEGPWSPFFHLYMY